MKLFLCLSFCLVLLCGCSSLSARKRENAAAYAALPQPERRLVDRGEIERGMGTNAVFIAWGKPSAVIAQPSPAGSGANQTWLYYGTRPALAPRWIALPAPHGYWTYEYNPEPYSVRYTRAEVTFHDGRVADWKKY